MASPHVLALALEDAIHENLTLEDEFVESLSEAITYRSMCQILLDQLHVSEKRRKRTERLMQQVMGLEPWHAEGE